MQIQQHISIQPYNTFGLNVTAKQYVDITTVTELTQVLKHHTPPFFILGGGSNMLLTQNVDALVLHLNLKGISIINETEHSVLVKAMAGENWHDFVLWCLSHGYGGLENLSLIPGHVGTAPIQNIGAYGVELKDVFESCEALHITTQNVTTFSNAQCKFGYRESVFKHELKDQYIITSVTFKLTKSNHKLKINYGAIQEQLAKHHINTPSINAISEAIIAIRQHKLPNPKEIGNSGSFFKNPVISTTRFKTLQANFNDIPHYNVDASTVKIPAGWLIETAGFKGKRFGNYGVHSKQALVLVNYGGAQGSDILKLAQLIQLTVKRLFHITLETEVNIF